MQVFISDGFGFAAAEYLKIVLSDHVLAADRQEIECRPVAEQVLEIIGDVLDIQADRNIIDNRIGQVLQTVDLVFPLQTFGNIRANTQINSWCN